MNINPRRPFWDDEPDGELESDRDFVMNNTKVAVALLDNALSQNNTVIFTTFNELLEFLANYGKEMANFVCLRPDECELDWRDIPTTVEDFLELNGHELAWWFKSAMEGTAQ